MAYAFLVDPVVLPEQFAIVSLNNLDLYEQCLTFARGILPGEDIISMSLAVGRGRRRLAFQARSFPTVLVNGLKYGSSLHYRGKKACYGYFQGRKPAIIDHILELDLGSGPDSTILCCVIRPFIAAQLSAPPPWTR